MLRYSYVTLTHLLYEFRYNVEYLRTLGTTGYGTSGMTTYMGDVTLRKVVRHCWQGLLLPCAPIHNASRWTLHVICSSF